MGRTSKIKVTGTNEEQTALSQIINARKTPSGIKLRATIVLLSIRGEKISKIATEIGCELNTVKKWILQWKAIPLTDVHQNKLSKDQIVKEVMKNLEDSPRSGRNTRLTQAELMRVQALSCENPEDYGIPVSIWTHELLSEQAKKLGISISPSYVGKVLKKQITAS